MSDDGRLPPAWGPPGGARASEHGLAGLFDPDPPPPPVPTQPLRPSQPTQTTQPTLTTQQAGSDPNRTQQPSPWSPVPRPPDPALLAALHQADLEASAATADSPLRSGGAHRARRQPARFILPAIGAAIAILLVVLGFSGWFGGQSGSSLSSPPITHNSPVGSPAVSTSSTPSPRPTVSASTAPRPVVTHTAKPRAVAVRPPVVHAPTVVLNQTATRGLAAGVANLLRTKHWVVTGVGNWQGNVPSTTVYYPPGMEAAARSLAYDLRVGRIRPIVPGMLANRLTVVLTSNPF